MGFIPFWLIVNSCRQTVTVKQILVKRTDNCAKNNIPLPYISILSNKAIMSNKLEIHTSDWILKLNISFDPFVLFVFLAGLFICLSICLFVCLFVCFGWYVCYARKPYSNIFGDKLPSFLSCMTGFLLLAARNARKKKPTK